MKTRKMKKILFSIAAVLSCLALSAGTAGAPAPAATQEINCDNYCPEGYTCVATNMKAKGYGSASGKDIDGISVYKKDGSYIAYVPGHGHLSLTWGSAGQTGWHFNANGGVYVILNFK